MCHGGCVPGMCPTATYARAAPGSRATLLLTLAIVLCGLNSSVAPVAGRDTLLGRTLTGTGERPFCRRYGALGGQFDRHDGYLGELDHDRLAHGRLTRSTTT